VLEPILRRIEAHVLAAERLHGDDTTVPVLAKGKTDRPTRVAGASPSSASSTISRVASLTSSSLAELVEAGLDQRCQAFTRALRSR
jgi:hypothetical protein